MISKILLQSAKILGTRLQITHEGLVWLVLYNRQPMLDANAWIRYAEKDRP